MSQRWRVVEPRGRRRDVAGDMKKKGEEEGFSKKSRQIPKLNSIEAQAQFCPA